MRRTWYNMHKYLFDHWTGECEKDALHPLESLGERCPGGVHKHGEKRNTAGCGSGKVDRKDMEKETLASGYIRISDTGNGDFLFLFVIMSFKVKIIVPVDRERREKNDKALYRIHLCLCMMRTICGIRRISGKRIWRTVRSGYLPCRKRFWIPEKIWQNNKKPFGNQRKQSSPEY